MTCAVDLPTPSRLWSRPACGQRGQLLGGQRGDGASRVAEGPHLVGVGTAALQPERDLVSASSGSTCYAFFARLGATRGGSSGILGYCGGHGASWSPASLSRSARSSNGSRDWGTSADIGPRVAAPAHQFGNGPYRQIVGHHRLDFVPRQRRRHLTAGPRPREPGAEDGLVGSVLVEVDEDPLPALLLPPVGRDRLGEPALELAGQGDGGGPDLDGVPARLEPKVDVQAPLLPVVLGYPAGRARRAGRGSASAAARTWSKPMPLWGRGRCAARRRARGPQPGTARGEAQGSRC